MPQQQRHLPPIGRADRRPGQHWQVQRASCWRATVPRSPLMPLHRLCLYIGVPRSPPENRGLNECRQVDGTHRTCTFSPSSMRDLKRCSSQPVCSAASMLPSLSGTTRGTSKGVDALSTRAPRRFTRRRVHRATSRVCSRTCWRRQRRGVAYLSPSWLSIARERCELTSTFERVCGE